MSSETFKYRATSNKKDELSKSLNLTEIEMYFNHNNIIFADKYAYPIS
jgi:hypothetical protein